jgi:Xaa-Pro aminopeptidase
VEVYRQRRDRVLNALDGCLTVVSAQGDVSGVTEDFRQDGDFFWLTGINEPAAHLILAPKSRYSKVILYLKSRDPEAERWTGPRDPVSPALPANPGKEERSDAELALRIASRYGLKVVYTDHGYKVLTAEIPRKLEEVEAWVAAARQMSVN